jgi:hypothetical protein
MCVGLIWLLGILGARIDFVVRPLETISRQIWPKLGQQCGKNGKFFINIRGKRQPLSQ